MPPEPTPESQQPTEPEVSVAAEQTSKIERKKKFLSNTKIAGLLMLGFLINLKEDHSFIKKHSNTDPVPEPKHIDYTVTAHSTNERGDTIVLDVATLDSTVKEKIPKAMFDGTNSAVTIRLSDIPTVNFSATPIQPTVIAPSTHPKEESSQSPSNSVPNPKISESTSAAPAIEVKPSANKRIEEIRSSLNSFSSILEPAIQKALRESSPANVTTNMILKAANKARAFYTPLLSDALERVPEYRERFGKVLKKDSPVLHNDVALALGMVFWESYKDGTYTNASSETVKLLRKTGIIGPGVYDFLQKIESYKQSNPDAYHKMLTESRKEMKPGVEATDAELEKLMLVLICTEEAQKSLKELDIRDEGEIKIDKRHLGKSLGAIKSIVTANPTVLPAYIDMMQYFTVKK